MTSIEAYSLKDLSNTNEITEDQPDQANPLQRQFGRSSDGFMNAAGASTQEGD